MTLTKLEQFFYDHAGYSYDPKTETKDEGRIRCAKILAVAEILAESRGYTFYWEIDPDIDSSDFDDSSEPWALWQVVAEDRFGQPFGALCGIDFGRDGHPSADNYSRVVQAEIVSEHIGDLESQVEPMTLHDAFQIVYELAEQNVIDELDNAEEHARQSEALNTFHDFVVNNSDEFENVLK